MTSLTDTQIETLLHLNEERTPGEIGMATPRDWPLFDKPPRFFCIVNDHTATQWPRTSVDEDFMCAAANSIIPALNELQRLRQRDQADVERMVSQPSPLPSNRDADNETGF